MPCRGPDYYDNTDTSVTEELRTEAHKLTRLLCYVLNSLPESSRVSLLESNEELRGWWEEHQEIDLLRKIKEYSKQYPNFNESELRRMITSGILK